MIKTRTPLILKKGGHGNIAREVSIYLSKRFCGLKNVELGKEFGGITGANVSYVCKKVDILLIKDRMLRKRVSEISEYLFYEV